MLWYSFYRKEAKRCQQTKPNWAISRIHQNVVLDNHEYILTKKSTFSSAFKNYLLIIFVNYDFLLKVSSPLVAIAIPLPSTNPKYPLVADPTVNSLSIVILVGLVGLAPNVIAVAL